MSKLLSANFMRVRKEKVFWILFPVMCALGIAIPVIEKINEIRLGYATTIDSVFGHYAMFVCIVLAIFCSFFVGQEYSDGTLRNKIISGKKRTDIYLANFITCSMVSLVMCCGFLLFYLGIGIPMSGGFTIAAQTTLQLLLTAVFLSIAFSAIYTLIAMSSTNKAVTAVICILLAFLFLFIGIQLNQLLNQPETVLGMAMENGSPVYKDLPNPSYLNAEKRKIVRFFYDFIPGGQAIQCGTLDGENLPLLPVYSSVIAVATTGIGLLIFKKKDLK